jgi:hypothetical protein
MEGYLIAFPVGEAEYRESCDPVYEAGRGEGAAYFAAEFGRRHFAQSNLCAE